MAGAAWVGWGDLGLGAGPVAGQAAAVELRIAMRLTSVLPHTLHLLESGRITVARARVFVTELEVLDDELAGQLDCDLADRAPGLGRGGGAGDHDRAGAAAEAPV